MKKKIVGVVAGAVMVVGIGLWGLSMVEDEREPLELISVCDGIGTHTAACVWIPLEESLRTESERELAARGWK